MAKYWYTFVENHPPREGTLAHKHWAAAKPYFPFYRLLSWLGAIGSLLGGFGVLVFAIYRALST